MTAGSRRDGPARFLAWIPLGRIGEPGEAASVAAFLASSAGPYVTGCIVHVDGAMTGQADFAHGG